MHAQQLRKHAALHVAHVRRALTHEVIRCLRENHDEHVAHALEGLLGALTAPDEILRLAAERGVLHHRDVALHDLRFLRAGGGLERLGLRLRLHDEGVHRGLEALQLSVRILHRVRRVGERNFFNYKDLADADAVRSASTF